LYALEGFVSLLGEAHFLSVIREDHDAYVYLLGSVDGTPSHVVAWRPVSADDTSSQEITLSASITGVITSWSLLGKVDSCSIPTLQQNAGETIFAISRCPLVLTLAGGSEPLPSP
jgi:hypothetical protein